ncbi:MAG TPA: cysteinyl-tRNA synthetase [Chloroflexi bacterium]|nr:cysteinyl-tRNA synthetase [Chloroflexota bacterium]HHW87343.1 cysteinyl-tRNA synthetase [Chloroflexota bacterium]
MTNRPGLITLFGSGETAPGAQKIYHALFSQMREAPRVAILETPAGFEPNSDYVAGQVAAYLQKRLQNFHPQTTVVPARKRGTEFSPDAPAIITPLYAANVIFMGPGSPTYAVRQLADSLAWHTLRALHRAGAALIFSSAMVLAASRHTLPIYEIYKVGEELHWKAGLDLFGDFGLSLIFVSHWNNGDGGEVLDTSRCYLGRRRFEQLLAMLPADPARRVIGIDENTALTLDLANGQGVVRGAGSITIMHGEATQRFAAGAHFDLAILGSYRLPEAQAGIPGDIWRATLENVATARQARHERRVPDDHALALLQQRTAAQAHKAWAEADRLRAQLEELGWRVLDTPDGSQLEAIEGKPD